MMWTGMDLSIEIFSALFLLLADIYLVIRCKTFVKQKKLFHKWEYASIISLYSVLMVVSIGWTIWFVISNFVSADTADYMLSIMSPFIVIIVIAVFAILSEMYLMYILKIRKKPIVLKCYRRNAKFF